MTKHEFHNALRLLLNIDGPQLGFLTDIQKDNFFGNPWRFFITCDDDTADKLWEVMFPPRFPKHPSIAVVDFEAWRRERGWSPAVRRHGVPAQAFDITEPYEATA